MPAVTIANTFGALEIGSSVAVFLYGIVTLQCHLYFARFSDDRPVFKILIASIWLLETGHTIAMLYEVYITTIILWGQTTFVVKFPAVGVVIILGGMITTLVQTFFSYRLFVVLPKPYNSIGIVTALTAFARCIMSTYGGIKEIIVPTYVDYVKDVKSVIMAVMCMGAAVDVIIAMALMYFLLQKRDKTMIRSVRLIDRLLGFTIRTGLITSMTAVLVVIIYFARPNDLIYLAVYMSLAKLYTNSLLSSLNARKSLRDELSKSVSVEVPRITTSSRAAFNNPISIEMKTVTEYQGDKF
ncbi:hypothetical protein BDN70DRAFT_843117 [Pholiota conissans]|uniref:DUF6534 domain-containing protein n=1 Tax=Pholiota conissans TaxID=109636 RepID=A0A9P6CV43_9AGAR|nr:hypothetical protein BDN70DRAFT_843117 [Pholiota conissans]